jgi:hypothetical protein
LAQRSSKFLPAQKTKNVKSHLFSAFHKHLFRGVLGFEALEVIAGQWEMEGGPVEIAKEPAKSTTWGGSVKPS